MKVKIEEITGYRVKLHFVLDENEFDKALSKVYQKKMESEKFTLSQQDYIKKNGAEQLHVDTINTAVNDAYLKALDEYNLKPLSSPMLEVDMTSAGVGKSLKFTLEFDIYPSVTLGKYKKVVVKKMPVVVTDDDINAQLAEILKAHSTLVKVDRAAKDGDTVIIDFVGSVDGVQFEGGKAEKYSLTLGSGAFIPGFEEQLVGMKKGENKDITVTFPDNYPAENLKGKDAIFAIRMHEIQQTVLPEFNESFVKSLKLSGISTTDEYKSRLKSELERKKQMDSDRKFVDDCISKVVEDAKVEIPDALIFQRVDWQVEKMEQQAKQYGMTIEQLLQFNGIKSEQEYRNLLVRPAEDELIKEMVLAEIAKVEGLKVTKQDIDKQIAAIIKETGKSEAQIREHYTEQVLTPYILNEKAIDFIKNNALVYSPGTITLVAGDGKETVCDIVFTHHSDKFGKDYVVFTSRDTGDTSAAIYLPDRSGMEGGIEQIDSDEEWQMIEALLAEFAEQNK